MRIDPDTCRDADLLAAEVRRLRNVLAADDPWLTDAEREAVFVAWCDYAGAARMHHRPTWQEIADGLFALLERTK